MTFRLLPVIALSLAVAFATSVNAEPAPKMAGGMLVNTSGMTLYTFDNDAPGTGKSKCNGPCAALWPPALAAADATPEGDLTIVTRDDGTKQWAYKGKPIYQYSADKKAGDISGDNFKGMWHAVK
jgi:predicted lipoprotein with Yx(FWY)xxD motif